MSPSKRTDEIRSACRAGCIAMIEKFEAGAVHPKGNNQVVAWGQYIDVLGKVPEADLGNQYGIYGTSAAVQVLAMKNVKEHGRLIRDGLSVLPLVDGTNVKAEDEIRQHFVDKGDLFIVHKVCALLDAAVAVCATNDRPNDLRADVGFVLDYLLQMRIPEAGWPDYKKDGDHQGADPHATAVALLSISRCVDRPQNVTIACREALTWFKDYALDQQSIVTISMVVSAMNQLPDVISDSKDLTSFQARAELSLESWIRATSPYEIQRSLAATEHWQPEEATRDRVPSSSRFDFLLYLPHCLAALAIMSSTRLCRVGICRRFVVQSVELVADGTKTHGHFVAAGRSLVSAVEHLWLFRLLHEFERTNLYGSRMAATQDLVAERQWRRYLAGAAVVGIVGLVVLSGTTGGAIKAIAEALLIVLIGLTTAVVLDILKDRT